MRPCISQDIELGIAGVRTVTPFHYLVTPPHSRRDLCKPAQALFHDGLPRRCGTTIQPGVNVFGRNRVGDRGPDLNLEVAGWCWFAVMSLKRAYRQYRCFIQAVGFELDTMS